MLIKFKLFCIYLSIIFFHLFADIQVADLFKEHAVIQQKAKVPVWGRTDNKKEVIVKFRGKTYTTAPDAENDGYWFVLMDPMQASDKGEIMTITCGKDQLIIKDILTGEVWLCSGQSNMEWTLATKFHRIPGAQNEIQNSADDLFRVFTVGKQAARLPQKRCQGEWTLINSQTTGSVAATAYFFGKELRQKYKVPVGIIISSWGGTVSDAWYSIEAYNNLDPKAKSRVPKPSAAAIAKFEEKIKAAPDKLEKIFKTDNLDNQFKDPETQKKLLAELKDWVEISIAAEAAGDPIPYRPIDHWNIATQIGIAPDPRYGGMILRLFNGMIAPLIPYAIKGTAWYQGEADAMWERGQFYHHILISMFTDWRVKWKEAGNPNEDWPLLICQIANFNKLNESQKQHWVMLQECQALAVARLPKAGLVVSIDVCAPQEITSIHPPAKALIGKRMLQVADGLAYGGSAEWQGPVYKSLDVKGSKIYLTFDHIGSGLELRKSPFDTVSFEVKTDSVVGYVPVEAIIKDNQVILTVKQIKDPVEVRYAWQCDPAAILYNKEGFPAGPFRTDIPENK